MEGRRVGKWRGAKGRRQGCGRGKGEGEREGKGEGKGREKGRGEWKREREAIKARACNHLRYVFHDDLRFVTSPATKCNHVVS